MYTKFYKINDFLPIWHYMFFNGHKNVQEGSISDRICNLLTSRIRIHNSIRIRIRKKYLRIRNPSWTMWFPNCRFFHHWNHRVHIGERWNRGSVSALSAGAYTATLFCTWLYVIGWKGVGVHPSTLTSQGWFYHHDGMYARSRQSLLCVYSVTETLKRGKE
jgi:hypothetical protein